MRRRRRPKATIVFVGEGFGENCGAGGVALVGALVVALVVMLVVALVVALVVVLVVVLVVALVVALVGAFVGALVGALLANPTGKALLLSVFSPLPASTPRRVVVATVSWSARPALACMFRFACTELSAHTRARAEMMKLGMRDVINGKCVMDLLHRSNTLRFIV